MKAEKRKVLLLDGHSLAYRAFFALPATLSTTGGQITNAVFGFTSMLLKVLGDERPDAVVVAFDGPRSELRRTAEFPEYKAHRPSMPDELRNQMGIIEELLEKMRIPVVREVGYEADDLLGAMAAAVERSGDQAVIVSGDRDTLQLAGPGVKILMITRGISEAVSYDREAVVERYGVPPEKIPDIIGLKGDASDNIPGIPGIGEKGAISLVGRYGSLEGVYGNLDTVGGVKRKRSLEENRDLAFLSRDLATIDREAPFGLELEGVEFARWDRQDVMDYLCSLEFKTLAGRFQEMFGGEMTGPVGVRTLSYSLVERDSASECDSFIAAAGAEGYVGVSASLSGSGYCDYEVDRIALAVSDRVMVLALDEDCPARDAASLLLGSDEIDKSFHDGKGCWEALEKAGLRMRSVGFDTALAAYLENPSLGTYRLWDLWERALGGAVEIEGVSREVEEQPSLLDQHGSPEELATAAAMVYHLTPVLGEKIESAGMGGLFRDLEMPLLAALKEMEVNGVGLDPSIPRELAEEAASALARIQRRIFDLAGGEFNIGSTKQLSRVLFDELGLPTVKKTKTGYSTDSSVLETLCAEHPIAGEIIEYREYSKLKSTYFDVLPQLVCPSTGRLHCNLNQTATATGRISSSNPNLQNIPVRTEAGRRMREAFVPGRDGWRLLVADYSQIELRVLAHMSADPLLLESFARDADIHAETAALVFGVDAVEVTPEMRRMAKVVNFGIVYGMGYFGLSSRLGISMEEATRFIDTYFERYDGVRAYRDRCIEVARKRGYAETLMGRRRYIPELGSGNRQTRELGERLAINTPLQGTAADIIKKAMVDLAAIFRSGRFESRMTLQIHDELIFEVPAGEAAVVREEVERRMSGAASLLVPLKIEVGLFDNWGQAKH